MPHKGSIMYRAAMKVMPEDRARLVTKGLDIIGDIAVIKIPKELESDRFAIARVLLKELSPHVKGVLRKTSPVGGTYRTIGVEWLAGERRTVTVHKEFGCLYRLDLTKVYFSPRLATERMRIASQVERAGSQETIVNMFSGIGCFSIVIAKHAKPARVYSIDLNPIAIQYAEKNAALNKVEGVVIPILGEAREIIERRLRGVADRVIMQLPERAQEFLDAATLALKPSGGTIHYYRFVNENELEPVRLEALERLNELGYKGGIAFERRVSQVAPRRYEMVFDLIVARPGFLV